MKVTRSFLIAAGALVLAMSSQVGEAATLSVSVSGKQEDNTSWNISDYGTLDWAIWAQAPTDPDMSTPFNRKLNGTAISNITSVGGSLTTSANSPPNWDFAYTDGTNPSDPGTDNVGGVFTTPVATTGTGLSLTVTLPTTGLYEISLWAAGYHVTSDGGMLTASLAGAADQSASFFADNTGLKDMYLYTIRAQADTAGDSVTLSLVNADAEPLSFAHVIISAVAISEIPEASVAALSMAGLCLASAIRRRR